MLSFVLLFCPELLQRFCCCCCVVVYVDSVGNLYTYGQRRLHKCLTISILTLTFSTHNLTNLFFLCVSCINIDVLGLVGTALRKTRNVKDTKWYKVVCTPMYAAT